MIAAILYSFADAVAPATDQALPAVTTAPIDNSTLLGGIAVIISLIISAVGLFRSFRLDTRTAKKQDIDTVIDNYRLLLSESKERESKLEKMVNDQREQLNKQDRIIDEQRVTIEEQKAVIKQQLAMINKLKSQLAKGKKPDA